MSPHPPLPSVLTKPSTKPRKATKIFTETKETLMISILAQAESQGLPSVDRSRIKRDHNPERERLIKKNTCFDWKHTASLMVWYLSPMYSMLKGSKSFCCSILATTSQTSSKPLVKANLSNGLFHAIHVDGGIIFMLPNWDLSVDMVGAKGMAALDMFFFKQNSRYIYIYCIYFFWGRWQVST